MSLTVHLLTKNNATTLPECLESIANLNAKTIVGDFSSTDETASICKHYKAIFIPLPWEKNYAKARNDIVASTTTDWQFYIEPWEIIQSGHEQLLWAITQNEEVYNVYNVQGNLLTKQTRLWKKSSGRRFVRPVYESLDPDTDNPILNCVITGVPPDRNEETMGILLGWQQQQPHAADTEYYIACTYLTSGRYDEFLRHAKNFLFRTNTQSAATLLTNYYMAMVLLFVKNNASECVNHIIYCLCQQPTMAEFWCLLGDAFIKLGQWHRATAFYDNAIVLGSRRSNLDSLPIEIVKYKEYPEKMLNKCREVIANMHNQNNTSNSSITTVA